MSKVLSSAYELAIRIDTEELKVSQARRSVAELIDVLVAHGIGCGGETEAAARRIVQMQPGESDRAWICWSRTIVMAQPSHSAVKLAFGEFSEWLTKTTSVSQGAFLGLLPLLAPRLVELRSEGVCEVISTLNQCKAEQDCQRIVGVVGQYAGCDGRIVVPLTRLLAAAVMAGDLECVGRFGAASLVNGVRGDRGAHRLFRAMPSWDRWPEMYGVDVWRAVLFLVLAITSESCSSAEYVVRRLQKVLRQMKGDLRVRFVADVRTLVDAIGIRVIGFSLGELPSWYQTYGVDCTREFVRTATACAERYGRTAGDWFLERKTAAARGMLSRG
jgi:hypothetical protein